MITKPMLAGKCEDINALTFPVLATPKLDGIRCLVIKGKAVSRKFKSIPNTFIRKWIEANCPDGFDGEIMVQGRAFNDLSGDVRREDGSPDFRYHVFDYVKTALNLPYQYRIDNLRDWNGKWQDRIVKVLPTYVNNVKGLEAFEVMCLEDGYEGVMVRSPQSPYKCGRSTTNEGYLLKIKRFEDDEAVVIGYEEEMHNNNPAEKDAFGRTERSSCKANLVGKDTLGKLVCRSNIWPKSFELGTGFSAKNRAELWNIREQLLTRIVKYKYQRRAKDGITERPRHPVWLGFRDKWDM